MLQAEYLPGEFKKPSLTNVREVNIAADRLQLAAASIFNRS
jgi:hypothetical protein